MTATGITGVQAAVAAECDDLADVLSGGGAALWDAPSLCAGWRVREVVAHVTMPARYSFPAMLTKIALSRGSFTRASDRIAATDADLGSSDLLAALRSNRLKEWKPPGSSGAVGALVHVVVHGLDITVPTGVDRAVPADRLGLVLDALTQPRSLTHFGVDLGGVTLQATDLDWSHGTGPVVSAAGQDLALALANRPVSDRLDGRVPWLSG